MRKIALIMLFMANTAFGGLIELEPLGETYPIVESDLNELLQIKAQAIDMPALVDKYFKPAFKRVTTAKLTLPQAPANEVRRITPRHVLQAEVYTLDKAGKKRVIYPKGYNYNPLDYMQNIEEYIIINGTNEGEIAWLQSQPAPTMVIISDGNVIDFMEIIQRPAYILSDFVKDGLHIRYTPSRVVQEGNQLVVYEYLLNEVNK